MAEIEFTIDTATGRLDVQIKDVRGPACDDVARLVKTLLGSAAQERTTPEYFLRAPVRPRARPHRA